MSLTKYAYKIFAGSINPTNSHFNAKLRDVLYHFERCLVCRLTDRQWKHPDGIISRGNTKGRCSAKIAEPLVPQAAVSIVHQVETHSATVHEYSSIKFTRVHGNSRTPTKGTSGSAGYDLFPTEEVIIPPNSRSVIDIGIRCEMPANIYGQIKSRSGLAAKHQIDAKAGVIDSDYQGIIKVILHNSSNLPFTAKPSQAIAQILFIPLANPIVNTNPNIDKIERGAKGFGSTDAHAHIADVLQLKPATGRPPGTTFLGSQPSQTKIRLNTPDGPEAPIVIDSGSNISLVSSKLLETMDPPLRVREGQNIQINQVTGRSSTNRFVPMKLHFGTDEGPVALDIEAYVVKDMNAPLILGNDFADQYSLSILREDGSTKLRLGNSSRTITMDSSVHSSFLETRAYHVQVAAKLH